MADSQVWRIGDVARLSGVTSRTLRHYDAVGLLTPRSVGPGGRRMYGRAELLRLQEILVLRELGVDLTTVATVLDGPPAAGPDAHAGRRSGTTAAAAGPPQRSSGASGGPPDGDATRERRTLTALRQHHDRLIRERDRFDRLARTVATTITSLERGQEMPAEELYAGFDHSRYEPEARRRWGDAAVDDSTRAWESLGADGRSAHHAESAAVNAGLAALLAEGADVGDPRVQDLVARHHAQVSVFWTPTAEAYRELGRMYVEDERFTATYDTVRPGLARYLSAAMDRFADTRLP